MQDPGPTEKLPWVRVPCKCWSGCEIELVQRLEPDEAEDHLKRWFYADHRRGIDYKVWIRKNSDRRFYLYAYPQSESGGLCAVGS